MAQLSILAGATSVSINVFLQDSSSTIGAGLAAVATAGGTLLAGTKAYYSFSGANAASTSIALAVLAATSTGWTTAGIVTIDDTNMKGVNRIDLPNAALAAAKGRSVTVYVYGGTNMAPCVTTIELTGWDNQDAVHGGMTALPAVAANAAGGLPVSIAGALDLDEMNVDIEAIQTSTAGLTYTVSNKVDANVYDWNGTAVSSPATAGIPDVNVKNINTVATTSVTTVSAVQGLTTADTITTYTGNTKQTGDSFATLTGVNTELAAVPASTATLVQMVKWIFMLARNLITQSATTTTVLADDSVTTVATSTVSDSGTVFSRGKMT